MASVDASDLVIPAFHDVLGDVMAHGHTHYWLHGGRESTKSSFVSVAMVLLPARPEANAVVVRRFSNALRDSVFEQVQWAIAELGLERWFRAGVADGADVPADRAADRVPRDGRPAEAQGHEVRARLRRRGVVRGAGPVRRRRGRALDSELAEARRGRLLDLLHIQPAADAVELGEPRGAGARAARGHARTALELPGRGGDAPGVAGCAVHRRGRVPAGGGRARVAQRVPGRGDGDRRVRVRQRRGTAAGRRAVPRLLSHAKRRGLGVVPRGDSFGAGGYPGSGGCSCSRSSRRTGRRRPRPGPWWPRL